MAENIRHFVIRIYGIILNENGEVLVSDEYVHDMFMTKFPGGGLEFGEGPEDCLKREAMEEFGQKVDILSHFYTTGFFQKALFYDSHQLISIYYRIAFPDQPVFKISSKAFDFKEKINGSQSFRWISVKKSKDIEFTFPVDRYVLNLLKKEIR